MNSSNSAQHEEIVKLPETKSLLPQDVIQILQEWEKGGFKHDRLDLELK